MLQSNPHIETCNRILLAAGELAAKIFGKRLQSVYALGSLAHGGFTHLVSDLDAGIILVGPLEKDDSECISEIVDSIRSSNGPLSSRLSVFWGSIASLNGDIDGGRFSPIGLLDLIKNGRLICGTDIRHELRSPTHDELLIFEAEFALKKLSSPAMLLELKQPGNLLNTSVRDLTKRILLPVRLLFTGRTGEIGSNDQAVAYFLKTESGPHADLVNAALAWRSKPPSEQDGEASELIRHGLLPLYRLFANEYRTLLKARGMLDLARAFNFWEESL
jgi:hypothetical protein